MDLGYSMWRGVVDKPTVANDSCDSCKFSMVHVRSTSWASLVESQVYRFEWTAFRECYQLLHLCWPNDVFDTIWWRARLVFDLKKVPFRLRWRTECRAGIVTTANWISGSNDIASCLQRCCGTGFGYGKRLSFHCLVNGRTILVVVLSNTSASKRGQIHLVDSVYFSVFTRFPLWLTNKANHLIGQIESARLTCLLPGYCFKTLVRFRTDSIGCVSVCDAICPQVSRIEVLPGLISCSWRTVVARQMTASQTIPDFPGRIRRKQ